MDVSVQGVSKTDTGAAGVDRAQRFDLEKKTIIESCFSKKDTDGSVLESYITHIRITEDAAYPSSPPPPNSNPDGKKPRLIIVAVRKTGRVRMHKARENANGTFSIGKTWPLDDLTAVESFSTATPANNEEERQKHWAGQIGFIVTIGKPYYWQASTPKEKQFFIASLVKIFIRYTGGKTPLLIGFEGREREQLLAPSPSGAPPGRPPPRNAQSPLASSQPVAPLSQLPRQPSQGSLPATTGFISHQPFLESRGTLKPSSSLPSFTDDRLPSQDSISQSSAWRGKTISDSDDVNVVAPLSGHREVREPSFENPSPDPFSRFDDSIRSELPSVASNFASRLTAKEEPDTAPERSATPTSQRTFSTADDARYERHTVATVQIDPSASAEQRPRVGSQTSSMMTLDHSVPPERGPDPSLMPAPLLSPFMREAENEDEAEIPVAQYLSDASQRIPVINSSLQVQPDASSGIDDRAVHDSGPERSRSAGGPTITVNSAVVQESSNRPGLGPMIKKKSKVDIANSFRKAATVANAFKPRIGGAADRIREAERNASGEPDGITSVVPAPSLVRTSSNNTTGDRSAQPTPMLTPEIERLEVPLKTDQRTPQTEDVTQLPEDIGTISSNGDVAHDNDVQGAQTRQSLRKTKPASVRIFRELEHLGVDSSFLDSRGIEFATLLDEFGWTGHGVHTRDFDQMTLEMDREIQKAQAGEWLDRLEEEDERVAAISSGLDVCLSECEELEGLLTLYSVELGTLNEDVAYIEAQSQGLQVQAANQKLLRLELDTLLNTVSITDDQLQAIRTGSLRSYKELQIAEGQIITLFKAMSTIDPQLRLFEPHSSSDTLTRPQLDVSGRGEVGNMQILKEKQIHYKRESNLFLGRLKRELLEILKDNAQETTKVMDSDPNMIMSRRAGKTKIDAKIHESARALLWRYSPLLLYARLVNIETWMEMLRVYEQIYKGPYLQQLKNIPPAWERLARKRGIDESDLLFTAQAERQTENVVTTTRKMTVKRAGTIGKALRSVGDNAGKAVVDKGQEGTMFPYEAFEGALDEMFLLVFVEQNFIVELFHASSLESSDFLDAVMMPPERRRGTDLRRIKLVDPDRNLGKIVLQSIEEIFSLFPEQIGKLVELATSVDRLQLVGVLAAVERKLVDVQESNQEFLSRTLTKIQNALTKRLDNLIVEQIRAIDDTKVKIKKRKGVIVFMRTFRNFARHVENMLENAEVLDIRQKMNNAYEHLNESMFESLKAIARENPSSVTSGFGSNELEDKEALNYQIMLIENMHYYATEVIVGHNHVLRKWNDTAEEELTKHLTLYIGSIVRRPLGKLLDLVESIKALRKTLEPGVPQTSIALRASHSRVKFHERLSAYDSKTIRKGLEELRRRVEKHFDHEEDSNTKSSKALVGIVLQKCEGFYTQLVRDIDGIIANVYEGGMAIEWTPTDVFTTLKR